MTSTAKRLGEFELIAKYFAPLARSAPGAFGLQDDAAAFEPTPGHDAVLTTDAIVAGVHFLADDPAGTIAQKALRVNISDLAAKGATPRVYLLTLAMPPSLDERWLKEFAAGLKRDQARFAITLVGGDTVATPGPLTISVTALGEVPRGKMLTRGGAQPGDDIWITGTIGDAALGLKIAKGNDLGLSGKQRVAALNRYRVPEPQLNLGTGLIGIAHAALDVSDGLIADLGHICDVSGVGIELQADQVPLSAAASAALSAGRTTLAELLTGGDDYELAIAAPAASAKKLAALAERSKTKLTRIGRVVAGQGVVAIDREGARIRFPRTGFTHF
ncbi:MAG: thiamine-phosphate kinase [Micropepsaceae bacterium]